MATQSPGKEGGQSAAPKKGKALPFLMIVVGVAAGGAAGVLLVGPALAAPDVEGPDASVEHAEEGGSHGGEEGGGEEGGEERPRSELFSIPNVIVNPAGNPSRFLLVDLAIRLSTPEAAEELVVREAEARDRLLVIFGSRTVEELSDLALREVLKAEVATALSDLLETGEVTALFIPRFVIQ